MKDFSDKLAVVTGGGAGMGRELTLQLAAQGCNVAICDVSAENMTETARLVEAGASTVRVSTHVCNVADEASVLAFRDGVTSAHGTGHIHLLFNNAGIGGGGSFVEDSREEWERTFGVCWFGVYYCARAFLPLLLEADEGHIINTSSINGFWASLGPNTPHTAYSAAKFAVKGFSEALVTDLRLNAPHLKVSVVMPGHIGTDIALNTGKLQGKQPADLPSEVIARVRDRMIARGLPVHNQSDDQIRELMRQRIEDFRTKAPTTAAQAAEIILQGVKDERWRILVGDDARAIDQQVRNAPELAYEDEFMEELAGQGHLRGLTGRSG